MATIKEITAMCKAGKLAEAFQLAKEDYRNAPDNVWTQRSMGWVCYYILKENVELGNYTKMLACIDDLLTLEMLNVQNDAMIFDNANSFIYKETYSCK